MVVKVVPLQSTLVIAVCDGGLRMFKSLVKFFFLGKAAVEIGRERVDDYIDTLTARADECKSSSGDKVDEAKEYVKTMAVELSQKVWQRSESLESEMKEKLRRQVADFSLGALGDTTEINELRAEIATLRAEIAELKSSLRVGV
jgi:polyhydroxyalkanoate synthesis regulator phasin